MRYARGGAVILTLGLGLWAGLPASADQKAGTELSGFHEVTNPAGGGAVSTRATGRFEARISRDETQIEYELSYDFPDVPSVIGAQYVNQAHLHLGQPGTTGGIMVWLCQSADNVNLNPVVNETPTCPSPGGSVTGTLVNGDLVPLTAQLFVPKDGQTLLDQLIAALKAGAVYVNVHTDASPAGEIRGPLDAQGHSHR
jgi:hypothetical protein